MTHSGSSAAEFAARCFEDIRKLSADTEGVTREGYSPTESAVLDYFADLSEEFGLIAEQDLAGNVWLTRPGKNPMLPAIVSGSHADSVPQGGNYDGLAGIVAAMLVAKRLAEEKIELNRNYSVLMLRMEESSFFGKCYVGSLAMTGRLTEEDMQLRHRTEPITLGDAMRKAGCEPMSFTRGVPILNILHRMGIFLELHIEQGPTLDSSKDERVGLVTGIRGNLRYKTVRILGETAHSGAVDKSFRHDAVLAFADFAHRMDQAWDKFLDDKHDLVFTIGTVNTAQTAAISVVPGEVNFCIDIRSLSQNTLQAFNTLLREIAAEIEKARGVRFDFSEPILTRPFKMGKEVVDLLKRSASRIHLPVKLLASGAGHDSCVFGNIGLPVGMIFVANQNGSHNPREAMKLEDFLLGADLLYEAVREEDATNSRLHHLI